MQEKVPLPDAKARVIILRKNLAAHAECIAVDAALTQVCTSACINVIRPHARACLRKTLDCHCRVHCGGLMQVCTSTCIDVIEPRAWVNMQPVHLDTGGCWQPVSC